MTTIAGVQGDGWAVVASDSKIVSVDDAGTVFGTSLLSDENGKVAQNGRYLLGAAGDVRSINLIHHAFRPPVPDRLLEGAKLDQFITRRFIPSLRKLFDDHGYSSQANKKAEHDSTIIAVVNATIYVIENDYAWAPDNQGIYAIGSGAQYALGAIHAFSYGKTFKSVAEAERALSKSVEIAARFDPNTGSPVRINIQTTDRRKR